jgi:hypothetical protein
VGVVLVDDVGAVDLGIDGRDFLQCLRQTALVKKPMKPSFTPCFFSNTILVLGAQVHHRLHVHLVEGGEHGGVSCASLRRRAMVWRSLVIFTRSSRTESSCEDGARGPEPERLAPWPQATQPRRAAIAASTSPLSTWPRLPEPANLVGRHAAFGSEIAASARRTSRFSRAGLRRRSPAVFSAAP